MVSIRFQLTFATFVADWLRFGVLLGSAVEVNRLSDQKLVWGDDLMPSSLNYRLKRSTSINGESNTLTTQVCHPSDCKTTNAGTNSSQSYISSWNQCRSSNYNIYSFLFHQTPTLYVSYPEWNFQNLSMIDIAGVIHLIIICTAALVMWLLFYVFLVGLV